jgi:hypothetical protein
MKNEDSLCNNSLKNYEVLEIVNGYIGQDKYLH